MGYEAGIASNDKELIEFISSRYREKGETFDADYALSNNIIYNTCGWAMADVSRDIIASSIGKENIVDELGDDWELDIVPVSVLRELTDAYQAFADTPGGNRILACDRLEIDYMVGNADSPDEALEYADPQSVVYISPESMAQAMDALGSTGHGDVLEGLLDEYWRIGNIGGMIEILDWIDEYGADTVLWYESY